MFRLAKFVSMFTVGALAAVIISVPTVGETQSPPRADGERGAARPALVTFEVPRDQAAREVGFDLARPTFLPVGFVPGRTFVTERRAPGPEPSDPARAGERRSVTQYWSHPQFPNEMVVVVQNPELDGILFTSPIQIGSRIVDAVTHPANEGRPFAIAEFFWKDGPTPVWLIVSLNGAVSQEVAEQIASSVVQ